MQRKHKKVFRAKHSNSDTKVQKLNPMVETLKKVQTIGGTITYHFISERLKFTKDNPEGEVVEIKSMLHSDINPQVFFKFENNRSIKRTYEEIIQLFQEIAQDYGASYFEIG